MATVSGKLFHSRTVQGKKVCILGPVMKGQCLSKPKEPELVWRVLFFWFPDAGACLELESIFDHECVQCSKSKRPEKGASESENIA